MPKPKPSTLEYAIVLILTSIFVCIPWFIVNILLPAGTGMLIAYFFILGGSTVTLWQGAVGGLALRLFIWVFLHR